MKKMVTLLEVDAKDILFYISTNEKIDMNTFHDLKCIFIEDASAVEDLFALSKCDFIIGTVSTFSGWVSYLYNIPRFYFLKKDDYKDLSLEDFKIPTNNIVTFNLQK